MLEMRVNLARVHGAVLLDEGKHGFGLGPARGCPRRAGRFGLTRMHQACAAFGMKP